MLLKNPPHNIPRHFVFSTSLFCMIKQNKKITNLNSNSIASTCSGKFVVMSTGGGEKYRAFQTLRELSYSLNQSKTPTSIKLERQNLSPNDTSKIIRHFTLTTCVTPEKSTTSVKVFRTSYYILLISHIYQRISTNTQTFPPLDVDLSPLPTATRSGKKS
jgi:hypothetical protein